MAANAARSVSFRLNFLENCGNVSNNFLKKPLCAEFALEKAVSGECERRAEGACRRENLRSNFHAGRNERETMLIPKADRFISCRARAAVAFFGSYLHERPCTCFPQIFLARTSVFAHRHVHARECERAPGGRVLETRLCKRSKKRTAEENAARLGRRLRAMLIKGP